jgi:hypothetical protein
VYSDIQNFRVIRRCISAHTVQHHDAGHDFRRCLLRLQECGRRRLGNRRADRSGTTIDELAGGRLVPLPIIGALNVSVTSPKFTPETQSKFLSATGAVRAIMTRLSLSDEKLKTATEEQRRNQDTLNEFIKAFRGLDNLDVTSVLTFGARSDNYDMRLNSVLILGNVIDNQTVCVPLTHLNDPELDKTDYGINGRANLLGIIAVVAPWALKQNFESIKATRDSLFESIRKNDLNLKQTYALLDNVQERLKVQTEGTNKSEGVPAEWRRDCKKYIEQYRLKPENTRNLQY